MTCTICKQELGDLYTIADGNKIHTLCVSAYIYKKLKEKKMENKIVTDLNKVFDLGRDAGMNTENESEQDFAYRDKAEILAHYSAPFVPDDLLAMGWEKVNALKGICEYKKAEWSLVILESTENHFVRLSQERTGAELKNSISFYAPPKAQMQTILEAITGH